jgi:hypothetical protein
MHARIDLQDTQRNGKDARMTDSTDKQAAGGDSLVDQAVAQGGAYEVLRRRLGEQGQTLQAIAQAINAQRLQEFGDSKMELVGRLRIRSEHNCVGRDIVQVGELLLFGFNVFIGLKSTTSVSDVFGLYRLVQVGDGYDVTPVDHAGSFLGDPGFIRDFAELYTYYKDARLLQLIVRDGKLLAAFQIGLNATDVRVFRWSIASSGEVGYIDARGERDIALPPPFDFEWIRASKSLEVSGRFPHLNILDTLFVETTGGDLTLKVENNTETGAGIYSEPVEDGTQSLDDAQFHFARVGALILLKVLPYRETTWRGLVYNTVTGKAVRQDAIVQACIQLPEDHGIIFPGGYYLQNGEHKAFDAAVQGMQYKRMIRSPNGEDVLYVFYERESGLSALLVYNMIQRRLQPPVLAHGYARLHDGRMVLFHAESNDPTRVHQMQVWQTPFASDEYVAARPPGTSFMGRIGNAELVRAVSNLLDLGRDIERDEVSAARYELLAHNTRRLFDIHHWIDDAQCGGLSTLLHEIAGTGESVLDEFGKVQDVRRQSDVAMTKARATQRALLGRMQPEGWTGIQSFVDALAEITAQRGHLLTIRDYRYIDTAAIDAMGVELQEANERVGVATGVFLAGDKALLPLQQALQALDEQAQKAQTATQTRRTARRHAGDVGRPRPAVRADGQPEGRRRHPAHPRGRCDFRALREVEPGARARRAEAQVAGLQPKRSRSSARSSRCSRRQWPARWTCPPRRSAPTNSCRADGATGGTGGPVRRTRAVPGRHPRQARGIAGNLRDPSAGAAGRAPAQGAVGAGCRQPHLRRPWPPHRTLHQSRRTERLLRRRCAGDEAARAGRAPARAEGLGQGRRHRIADQGRARPGGARAARPQRPVRGRRQRHQARPAPPLQRQHPAAGPDPAAARRRHGRAPHRHRLHGAVARSGAGRHCARSGRSPWNRNRRALSRRIPRRTAAGRRPQRRDGLDIETLERLVGDSDALATRVREFASARYRDGYEKGIHDHDATLILRAVVPLYRPAGPLVHAADARALAVAFWRHAQATPEAGWLERIRNAKAVRSHLQDATATSALATELAEAIAQFRVQQTLPLAEGLQAEAAAFLIAAITADSDQLPFTRYAASLLDALHAQLAASGSKALFNQALERLQDRPGAQWSLLLQWLQALAARPEHAALAAYAHEAAALHLHGPQLPHRIVDVRLMAEATSLLGQHPCIDDGTLRLAIDDLQSRLREHQATFLPAFRRYQEVRARIVQREREAMRLSEFKARPLTSFVRNRLINEVYLRVIGDNLAKQMGTVGEDKRSDLMGLLMLISPPGYGKTTLMEYVAHRLGLVFMKINGPSLGHQVRSLDPAQAPDATSRRNSRSSTSRWRWATT